MVLLINPTSGSILENSSTWYHISTHGNNHTRRWFHKWSSTLSDHQVKQVSSNTRAQAYQMDDPCYDIGGGAPPIGIKVKRSYIRYLKGYKWCHSIILSQDITNLHHFTPRKFLCTTSSPWLPLHRAHASGSATASPLRLTRSCPPRHVVVLVARTWLALLR